MSNYDLNIQAALVCTCFSHPYEASIESSIKELSLLDTY